GMTTDHSRATALGVFAALLCFFCGTAAVWGPDASWDLRNYHLYNAFAALNGKLGYDLAPAQMQTFHWPGLDILQYWIRRGLNEHPNAASAIFAIPQAVAAFLAFLIARRILPEGTASSTAI